MKESTRIFWKRAARYFFVRRFFSTFWSLIGIIFLIALLCLLPRSYRLAKNMRRESNQMLRESHTALRDAYYAAKIANQHLEEARELNHYLRQPFEVSIQLKGESELLDMTTTGKAIITPQKKEPEKETPDPEKDKKK